MPHTEHIKFSVNIWSHLYSLSQAIKYQQDNSGRCLLIEGELSHTVITSSKSQTIQVGFIHCTERPHYPSTENKKIIFGQLKPKQNKLFANIKVADDIFNELKKNLIEYADIEGIHIVVTLELIANAKKNVWDIVTLDYAMKGDR